MPIHAGCLLLDVVVVGAYIGLMYLTSMHPQGRHLIGGIGRLMLIFYYRRYT